MAFPISLKKKKQKKTHKQKSHTHIQKQKYKMVSWGYQKSWGGGIEEERPILSLRLMLE